MTTLAERVERLDAYAQIRQLAVRYAAAMKEQDGSALARLYVDDVRVPGGLTGREALQEAYFGAALTRLSISVLQPGTHVVELDPERPDRARGTVYTVAQIRGPEQVATRPSAARESAGLRPEGTGDRWMRQAICYFDRYAKRGDEWLFVTRDHQLFYGCDHDERPNHLPPANWPEHDTGTGTLPYGWPTWQAWEADCLPRPADGR